MADCCLQGSYHKGTPVGTETSVAGLPTYVTGPENATGAVMIITDIHGWKFNNSRILADKYAAGANVRVYIPDLFKGECAPSDPEEKAKWDLQAFLAKTHPRSDETKELVSNVARELKKNHKKTAAAGFCWGAPSVLYLGREKLIDACMFAHPTLSETQDFKEVEVPGLFLCAATDPLFVPESRKAAEEAMEERAKKGVWSKFQFYPGVSHGFAVRGDENDEFTATSMDDARVSAVAFFNRFLK